MIIPFHLEPFFQSEKAERRLDRSNGCRAVKSSFIGNIKKDIVDFKEKCSNPAAKKVCGKAPRKERRIGKCL